MCICAGLQLLGLFVCDLEKGPAFIAGLCVSLHWCNLKLSRGSTHNLHFLFLVAGLHRVFSVESLNLAFNQLHAVSIVENCTFYMCQVACQLMRHAMSLVFIFETLKNVMPLFCGTFHVVYRTWASYITSATSSQSLVSYGCHAWPGPWVMAHSGIC